MSEAESSIMTICLIIRILASMASLVVPSRFLSSSSLNPDRSLGGNGGGTTEMKLSHYNTHQHKIHHLLKGIIGNLR
jgi:hypothetical protein